MLQRWTRALALAAGIGLLAGCSAVTGTGGNGGTQTVDANLSGNWLLTGSLPILGPGGQSASTGMAATIDVNAGSVMALVSMQFPCTQGIFTAVDGTVVTGSIAADGSFTLVSPTGFNGNTLTVQGHVPSTAGGPWFGSYVAVDPSCGTFSGAITAAAMPLLTGTFAGSATLLPTGSFTGMPVTVTTNLQQGGYETGVHSTTYSNAVLGGTIAITGSPCLTSGTSTGASLASAVEGNTVLASYIMNDGSLMQMVGSIASADSSRLQVEFSILTSGSCHASFLSTTSPMVKQ